MYRPLSLTGILAVSLAAGSAASAGVALTGYIGGHKLTFTAQSIQKQASFTVKGSPAYLAITEVFPDNAKETVYRYRVSAAGIDSYYRNQKSLGFGPITYFVKVKSNPVGKITVTNNGPAVYISSVRGVTAQELKSIKLADHFMLSGLIPATSPNEKERLAWVLMNRLPVSPKFGITKGIAHEIRYANSDMNSVQSELELSKKWSERYNVPILLGMVSWWVGTPLTIPDGLGGKFGDLKYQQVCYSPNVEVAEDPELRAMVGERYNRHYGRTTPNMWSDTPWLTLNSDTLNNYRKQRMGDAIGLLKKISPTDTKWVCGIFLENEPRYWDTQMEAGNSRAGRLGQELWADFNPLTVAAAKNDGIDLNPNDGMSDEELQWLHRNVGKYMQQTVNSMNEAINTVGWDKNLPVYTHNMQFQHFFGGPQIGHATSEWAYAKGAQTGLEGMFSTVADYYRVREWGRWVNLNREESDGLPLDVHLWDLRVDYMMGGDLFNSYNWQILGDDRFFGYINEFVNNLPTAASPAAEAKLIDANTMHIKTPAKLQAFTSVSLPIVIAANSKGTIRLVMTDAQGNEFVSSPQNIPVKQAVTNMMFRFDTPAESVYRDIATVTLRAADAAGKPIQAISFNDASAKKLMLSLDLQAQRNLSQWIIKNSTAQRW